MTADERYRFQEAVHVLHQGVLLSGSGSNPTAGPDPRLLPTQWIHFTPPSKEQIKTPIFAPVAETMFKDLVPLDLLNAINQKHPIDFAQYDKSMFPSFFLFTSLFKEFLKSSIRRVLN